MSIDTEQGNDENAGAIDLGTSNIYSDSISNTLTLDAGNANNDGGNITFGLIDDNGTGSFFIDDLSIITSAPSGTDGTINIANDVTVDGFATFDGPVDLVGGGIQIDIVTNGTTDADDITFTGTVDDTGSDDILFVDTGGTAADVDFQADVGATNELGNNSVFGSDNNIATGKAKISSVGNISI